MSSSDTTGKETGFSLQARATPPSSATSQPSSIIVAQGRFRSRMKEAEDNLRASVIASLGLIKLSRSADYAEQVRVKRETGSAWFGIFDGLDHLIPIDTPDHVLEEAEIRVGGVTDRDPRIMQGLVSLWLTTKHEKLSEADKEDTLKEYDRKLSGYPPHLALAAISDAASHHFFPSWSQMEENLTAHGGWRISMIFALQRARPLLPQLRSQGS